MGIILSLLISFIGTNALACQPPPLNYFELGNLDAIINSQDVRNKMSKTQITGVRLLSGQTYVVESKECALEVVVEAKQMDRSLPCGGPFTFTAKVVGEVVCK